jgi:perosamine synthetase
LAAYREGLSNVSHTRLIDELPGSTHAAWSCTVLTECRESMKAVLASQGVESGEMHYRNDRYSVFGGRVLLKNMDWAESRYLVLPLHMRMCVDDVFRICEIIAKI